MLLPLVQLLYQCLPHTSMARTNVSWRHLGVLRNEVPNIEVYVGFQTLLQLLLLAIGHAGYERNSVKSTRGTMATIIGNQCGTM